MFTHVQLFLIAYSVTFSWGTPLGLNAIILISYSKIVFFCLEKSLKKYNALISHFFKDDFIFSLVLFDWKMKKKNYIFFLHLFFSVYLCIIYFTYDLRPRQYDTSFSPHRERKESSLVHYRIFHASWSVRQSDIWPLVKLFFFFFCII